MCTRKELSDFSMTDPIAPVSTLALALVQAKNNQSGQHGNQLQSL